MSELVRREQAVLLVDAACAGATTADVRAVLAQPAVAAALADADLVTLTLGGNDVGWTEYLQACSTAGEQEAPGASDRLLAEVDARVAAAGEQARRTLADLAAATDAQVVVLGYPHLVDVSAPSPFVSSARAAALAGATDRLNAAVAAAATAEGAAHADVTARFAGHGAGSAEPWVVLDPEALDRPDTLHPTAEGYLEGYYPAVLDAVGPGLLGQG